MPKVRIAHYDDRGDPSPPNSFRVEISIGRQTYVPIEAAYGEYNGCMPEAKAKKLAEAAAKALRIKLT
jgi:hypothetical protein